MSLAAPARNLPRDVAEDGDEKLRTALLRRLSAADGNVSEVARSYGKARNQIHRWMGRFGIDPKTFRRSRKQP